MSSPTPPSAENASEESKAVAAAADDVSQPKAPVMSVPLSW